MCPKTVNSHVMKPCNCLQMLMSNSTLDGYLTAHQSREIPTQTSANCQEGLVEEGWQHAP